MFERRDPDRWWLGLGTCRQLMLDTYNINNLVFLTLTQCLLMIPTDTYNINNLVFFSLTQCLLMIPTDNQILGIFWEWEMESH